MVKYDIKYLKEKWDGMWDAIIPYNSPSKDRVKNMLNMVIDNYQHGRAYHNITHIEHGLRLLDDFRNSTKTQLSPMLELAWWFHDFVYDPASKHNEMDSLVYLVEQYSPYLNKKDMIIAGEMILATSHLGLNRIGIETDVIMDIDLSILGEPKENYDVYEKGIKEEYYWVDDKTFKAERAKILRYFLEGDIYKTEYFKERFDKQARINLENAIKSLDGNEVTRRHIRQGLT